MVVSNVKKDEKFKYASLASLNVELPFQKLLSILVQEKFKPNLPKSIELNVEPNLLVNIKSKMICTLS